MTLRAEYRRDVERLLAAPTARSRPPLSDGDLAHLPPPVQRYLRVAGVVGQPRVRNFRARLHGRIRSGRDARWIPLAFDQHNFVDPPARLFYMAGSMFMIPIHGYHRYVGPSATMRVRAAGLMTIATAAGDEMNQSETVTMFNDMCVLAPATLVEPSIAWEDADAHVVRAKFTNAGRAIRADLVFGETGELIDFRSDDRYQLLPDGSSRRVRWSTPVHSYRPFQSVRLASCGEARWHQADGEYAYIELAIDDVRYDVDRF